MPDYRDDLTGAIYELESSSGKNKKAYVPNSVGALGGYQLTPIAFKEIQRIFPDKWKGASFQQVAVNDTKAKEAAWDYLVALGHQLRNMNVPVNNVNLLGAYHSGAGAVRDNSLGPRGREYISRYRALAGLGPDEVW